MVAIAEVLDSIQLNENIVLCSRYNPDYDSCYTTSMFDIEEQTFMNAHWFKSSLLMEDDFLARLDSFAG